MRRYGGPSMFSRTAVRRTFGARVGHRAHVRAGRRARAPALRPGGSRRVSDRNTERAMRSDLGNLCAVVCGDNGVRGAAPRARKTVAAFVERDGRDAQAGDSAPLRRQHRRRPQGRGVREDAREPRGAPCAQAHAPAQGPPAGAGRRGSPGRCASALLDAAGDRLIDDRNRALLAVAYDAMLRRAELAALQVTDLLIETPGDATLLVRRSKTDTEGRGENGLPRLRQPCGSCGPGSSEAASPTDGSFARCTSAARSASGSTRARCRASSKEMAHRAGLPESLVEGLSGHSARVGAAQDMICRGQSSCRTSSRRGGGRRPRMVKPLRPAAACRGAAAARAARAPFRSGA